MAKIAFVTGANGMTGGGIIEYLAANTSSEEWSKIIISSRSPMESPVKDPRVEFVALDFLKNPKELVKEMKEICAPVTHAYFSSYVHKDDFLELNSANASLFENFLNAMTEVSPNLENVTLQTGGKYYNVHLHPVNHPLYEHEPRQGDPSTNFYFPQEDFLIQKQKGQKWNWNVVRPQGIIGATYKPNGMNIGLSTAVYILTCKELGIEAKMPTNQWYWNGYDDCAYMPLIAEFTVFISTRPNKCANEAFNINNGDNYSPRHFWPRLCKYLGAQATPDQKFEKPWPKEGDTQLEISTVEFVTDHKDAWNRLCEKTGCESAKPTIDWMGYYYLQDWCYQRAWTSTLNISKAKKAGWTGWIDSYDAYIKAFDRFKELGQIPPF